MNLATALALLDFVLAHADDAVALVETVLGAPLTDEQRAALHKRHDEAAARRREKAAKIQAEQGEAAEAHRLANEL